jgi:hypothetical protein
VKTDEEKYCNECGKAIPITADVCPSCGARQPVPPIAKKRESSGFMGCLIAAVVSFLGVIIIGIIAAIAIPKFANTKQKAYVAEMKSDLRRIAAAEATYHVNHGSYTASIDSLPGFKLSEGIELAAPINAGSDGFAATVGRRRFPVLCRIAVGDRAAIGETEGEPVCGR